MYKRLERYPVSIASTHSERRTRPSKRNRFALFRMRWYEWEDPHDQREEEDSFLNFDFLSLLSKPKDYYKILELDYDATDEAIRSNYIRLALKWHPDKHKDEDSATSRFQEINEAYQVLNDPVKRREYDTQGMLHIHDYGMMEYLSRYKGLILTCNGLGMKYSIW